MTQSPLGPLSESEIYTINQDWLRSRRIPIFELNDALKAALARCDELEKRVKANADIIEDNYMASKWIEEELIQSRDAALARCEELEKERDRYRVTAQELMGLVSEKVKERDVFEKIVELCKEEIDHGLDLPSEIFEAVEALYRK